MVSVASREVREAPLMRLLYNSGHAYRLRGARFQRLIF